MSAAFEIEVITELTPIKTQTDLMFVPPGTLKLSLTYNDKAYATVWMDPEEAENLNAGLAAKIKESRELTGGE